MPSFAEAAAEATGVSARNVRRDVATAQAIPDDVAEIIKNTPIADHKGELRKLADLDDDEQREVARKIASGEAATVDEALARDAPEPPEQADPCPHCGSVERDADGDCAACREPLAGKTAPEQPKEKPGAAEKVAADVEKVLRKWIKRNKPWPLIRAGAENAIDRVERSQ